MSHHFCSSFFLLILRRIINEREMCKVFSPATSVGWNADDYASLLGFDIRLYLTISDSST